MSSTCVHTHCGTLTRLVTFTVIISLWGDEMMPHNNHKLKVKAMFALFFKRRFHKLWLLIGLLPHVLHGRHLDLEPRPQTQTHFGSWIINYLYDFIDLALNQLVNYLISKALWVSAQLPSSLQCCQVSLNHCAHMLAPRVCVCAEQPHTLEAATFCSPLAWCSCSFFRSFVHTDLEVLVPLESRSATEIQTPHLLLRRVSDLRLRVCVCLRHVLWFPSCSVTHARVWVKMHNGLMKRDWRNHERYCLNYWPAARSICFVWRAQPAAAARLTNLIKCTKCYSLTSPWGAIMAPQIERSPRGVFYSLAGDCLCQLADCIDYIDL